MKDHQLVRFGIVGMGIGRAQAMGIVQDPRAQVVALCDLDEARMERVAADLPAPVKRYTDYQALCADPDVDAIFVGTPNQWHVPVALAVVEAGKHVLVTKPLSDSEPAARRLVETAERAGVVNMMSLTTRFGSGAQLLGRLLERGELGEIYYARARSVRRSGIPDWGKEHFIRKGGGAMRDMGVHALDAAWWLMGCPEPATCLGVAGARFGPRGLGYWDYRPAPPEVAAQYEADDYAAGIVRFASGAAIYVESFWASHQPDEFNIELFGTEGGARLNPLTVYRNEDGRPADTTIQPRKKEGFAAVASHFIDCVLERGECRAPLRHGLIVQRMLEGVLASAELGREVRLDA